MGLTEYRDQINEIDDQILALLQKRAEISKKVGAVKAETGVAQVYVPDRQKKIIERLKAQNQGEFPEDALESIWTEILSASRSLQEPERVAFLGPVGSFGHLAALRHFGASTELIPVHPQIDIFTEVEAGRADYGVVAIENSAQGTVRDVLERFQRTPLWICAETFQPIRQHLLSKSSLSEIRCVYSHPQPFAQCRAWLRRYLSSAEQIEVVSTSEAAQRAAQETLNGLPLRVNSQAKFIRFQSSPILLWMNLIIQPVSSSSEIVFQNQVDTIRLPYFSQFPDKIGALHQVLGILEKAQLNLSYLESLPSRTKSWEYIFFTEMDGHIADECVIEALAQARRIVSGKSTSLDLIRAGPVNVNTNATNSSACKQTRI